MEIWTVSKKDRGDKNNTAGLAIDIIRAAGGISQVIDKPTHFLLELV